jgi:hypothetical protein
MRRKHIAAAFIVALSCALLNASCVQSQPAPPDAEGAPAIETKDDGDPFGDPDGDPNIGGGIGTEPPDSDVGSEPPVSTPSPGSDPPDETATMAECYAAGKGGTETREAFCRDECPPTKKRKCWSLVPESLVAWLGWCTWNFQ